MRIVFHGENAASFREGFDELIGGMAEILLLPDRLEKASDRKAFASADVIVGVKFDGTLPRPEALRLYHVPGAGYDAVDLGVLPPGVVVCNCFGHEQAIAEYVMAALLAREVPLADADRRLRAGEWAYWAGAADRVHGELAGRTIGLLGFGHIGKAIAARAKVFEMQVNVANRSAVATSAVVDRYFPLSELSAFWGLADAIVVSVPLTDATRGIVDARAFAAMRDDAVVFNVARGPVIEETALFDALRQRRIGGAVIDTWYRYPTPSDPHGPASDLPFHELPNLVMTPHMSGWTRGTIRRRQQTMADNIRRRFGGESCINVVHGA